MNTTEVALSQQARSVTEILVGALAMTAVTTIAAGHLTTLRRQPVHFASYQVLATTLIPTFPLAEFAIATYRTIKASRRTSSSHGIRYHICAALDMRAVSSTSEEKPSGTEKTSVPLCLVNNHNLECHRDAYDVRWVARLLALLIFTLQALLTLVFWIRRAQQGARTYLDDYVAVTAFGGIINALICVSITLVNTSWQVPERYISKFQTHFNEPSSIDLFINFAWRTRLPELRAALVLAISIQSAAFFTLRGYSTENDPNSLSCNMPMNGLWKQEIVPTSEGLAWMTMTSASCHKHLDRNYQSIGPTSEDIALVGYVLAFLNALYPAFLMLSLCATVPFFKTGRIRRNILPRFWWLIDTSGSAYIALSYGLCTITIWDLTSHRAWEQWMWKDSWSDRFWTVRR